MSSLPRQFLVSELPTIPEDFDLTDLQFVAQIMGVYKSKVKEHLGVPYKTDFLQRGKRLDEELTQKQRRSILNDAFGITTSQQRKYGYLAPSPDASEPFPVVPTMKSLAKVSERLQDPKEVSELIQFYEETLSMARSGKRPTSIDTRIRIKRDRYMTVAPSYFYYLSFKGGYVDLDGQRQWDKKKDLVAALKKAGFIVKNNNEVFKKNDSKSQFKEN